MILYRPNSSLHKYINLKSGRIEEFDPAKCYHISKDNPSYKGWVVRFFTEVPDHVFSEILGKRYIILIYKKGSRIYGVLVLFNSFDEIETDSDLIYKRSKLEFLKRKEITRYLNMIHFNS